MECRFCKATLSNVFIDLINAPASNSFLTIDQLAEPETFYPLKVYVCHQCFLVQLDEYKNSRSIFNDQYVYFSSYSKTWLKHAQDYTDMMIDRFGLSSVNKIIELASNDGYLLQYFKEKGIPVLGVEPTANTASVARSKGIETIVDFFGVALARQLVSQDITADIILGNNVLAHVPDIIDFVGGMKILLRPDGVITMEFPHLVKLIDNNQFDTIYHEHFSYLSLSTVQRIFLSQGLELFDVEELPTHGGSLRIFGKHAESNAHKTTSRMVEMLQDEKERGVYTTDYYDNFGLKALRVKTDLLLFLALQKKEGKKVAAYGAAAKGSTLLNYCGIKSDLIEYVIDANPHKQNKYLPASHIPVFNEEHLKLHKPDFVIILPWNLQDEIIDQISYIKDWNGKFVIPIPELKVL